jgi:hypothetical protein
MCSGVQGCDGCAAPEPPAADGRQQLALAATGIDPIRNSDERARNRRAHAGRDPFGWLQVQTIRNRLVIDPPDMFH